MAGVVRQTMTADQFLDWVVDQEAHYELVNGQPVMMVGVNRRHDRIAVNALVSLAGQLRGRACRPFTSETAIRIPAGNIRFPDLGVECGNPEETAISAAEPRLVVEVLSPSTSLFDRTTKLEEYKTVPGIIHILLVDPEQPQTRLYTRNGDGAWRTEVTEGGDAVVALPAIDASLAHCDLYDGISFRQRPTLVG